MVIIVWWSLFYYMQNLFVLCDTGIGELCLKVVGVDELCLNISMKFNNTPLSLFASALPSFYVIYLGRKLKLKDLKPDKKRCV